MENIPTAEELESYYSIYSYQNDDSCSPMTAASYNRLLDEFEKYRKTNRILDVGCGQGWFLVEAKRRGWEVYGTEFSPAAVSLCRNRGITMFAGKLNPDDFNGLEFDVITSFEVLEHINNPHEELTAIHTLLRRGGLFYCTTPNFNSLNRYYSKSDYNVIIYPEHLSYFTKRTLNFLARQHKFATVKFLSTGFSLSRAKASSVAPKKAAPVPQPITSTSSKLKLSDEALRKNIESKWYLKVAKRAVNSALTWSNLGMTLKGYYVKK